MGISISGKWVGQGYSWQPQNQHPFMRSFVGGGIYLVSLEPKSLSPHENFQFSGGRIYLVSLEPKSLSPHENFLFWGWKVEEEYSW